MATRKRPSIMALLGVPTAATTVSQDTALADLKPTPFSGGTRFNASIAFHPYITDDGRFAIEAGSHVRSSIGSFDIGDYLGSTTFDDAGNPAEIEIADAVKGTSGEGWIKASMEINGRELKKQWDLVKNLVPAGEQRAESAASSEDEDVDPLAASIVALLGLDGLYDADDDTLDADDLG